MRVLCDFDGVLARTTDFVCAVVTAAGYPYTAKEVREWDWAKRNPDLERVFQSAYDILDALPHHRAALAPYDEHTGAAFAVLSQRHDVDVVSANEAVAEPGIHEWLDANVLNAGDVLVRCIGRHGPDKTTLGYDVILDDNPTLAPKCAIVRRWRTWVDCLRLVRLVEIAHNEGRLNGTVLLLANTRWNESITDKGEL